MSNTSPTTWLPGRVLIRLAQVTAKTGLSRSTIYRLEADGRFPSRIKLSENTTAWDVAHVDEWISEREAASRKVARHEAD